MILLQSSIGVTIFFLYACMGIMVFGIVFLTAYYSYQKYTLQRSWSWRQGFLSLGKAIGISFLLVIVFFVIVCVLLSNVDMD